MNFIVMYDADNKIERVVVTEKCDDEIDLQGDGTFSAFYPQTADEYARFVRELISVPVDVS